MDIPRILGSGIKWNGFASAISTIGQLIIMLTLARVVGPEALGFLTLALVWIRIAMPLLELGFGNSVIQSPDLSSDQFSTLFWIQQGLALFLTLLSYSLIGMLMVYFFNSEIIQELIWLAAPLFLIAAPGLLHLALLKKQLKFKSIAQVQIGGAVMEIIIALGLLLYLQSVAAVIYGMLAKHFTQTILSLWLAKGNRMLNWQFNISQSKSLIQFGVFDLGSQIINQFSSQVDKLIIGKLLGATALGLYTLAWDIMITPLGKLTGIFNQTAFPLFSKIKEDPKELARTYHLINKCIFFIILPLFTLTALMSESFVISLFGSEWVEAAPLLAILLVAGIYKSISTTGYAIVLAKGRSKLAFFWNLFWTVSLTVILILSINWRPEISTAAWSVLLASLVIGWIWHYIIASTGQIEYRTFFINISKGLLYIIPSIMVVIILKNSIDGQDPIVGLVIIGFIGLLVYSSLLYMFEKPFLLTVKNQFKK